MMQNEGMKQKKNAKNYIGSKAKISRHDIFKRVMVDVTQNNYYEMQKRAEMQMRCNVGAVKMTQEHRSAAAPAAPEGGLTGNQLAPLTVKEK